METITSRHNPLVAHLRRLASSGSYRRERGEFLCDSPKLLHEALLHGAELLTVAATRGMALPDGIHAGVRLVEVPEDVMQLISPAKTPQGVVFTCRLPRTECPQTLTGARYLALDGVQDPGNVGTILRTLDAFEADGLVLLPGCADPFSPKTVRSSMGAVFRRGRVRPRRLRRCCAGAGCACSGPPCGMTRSTRARRTIPVRCSRSVRRGAAYLTRCSRSATRRCASPCRRAASRSMRRSRHRFSCGRHIAENTLVN